MCSRYTLAKDEVKIVIGELEIVFGIVARFNIAPSQKAPILIEDSAGIRMKEMKWGWKPHWSKQLLINAKVETVKTTVFSKFLGQRCLVPADGFYEWLPDKTPIRFTRPGSSVFCFAGLWNAMEAQPLDEPVKEESFVILTTTPNETVSPYITAKVHRTRCIKRRLNRRENGSSSISPTAGAAQRSRPGPRLRLRWTTTRRRISSPNS